MSANKEENEETFHQLESRLQKLESQRRLEEYERGRKKEQNGKRAPIQRYSQL